MGRVFPTAAVGKGLAHKKYLTCSICSSHNNLEILVPSVLYQQMCAVIRKVNTCSEFFDQILVLLVLCKLGGKMWTLASAQHL